LLNYEVNHARQSVLAIISQHCHAALRHVPRTPFVKDGASVIAANVDDQPKAGRLDAFVVVAAALNEG
jgi:hypothetical protein